MTRTSTFSVDFPPTRENSPSCRTWRSLAWSAGWRSPISSRKMVPPSAASNFPIFCRWAPVKAPRSCPNSSLSSRSRGMAAQLTLTNGLLRRDERWWMVRATRSFPVPVSPQISTVTSTPAARRMISPDLAHLRAAPQGDLAFQPGARLVGPLSLGCRGVLSVGASTPPADLRLVRFHLVTMAGCTPCVAARPKWKVNIPDWQIFFNSRSICKF